VFLCLSVISNTTRSVTHMMISNCFLRPLESMATSSPLSTRIVTFKLCVVAIFVLSCLVVNRIRKAQSGTDRACSRCQGPSGSIKPASILSSANSLSFMSKSNSGRSEGLLRYATRASSASGDDLAALGSSDRIGRRGSIRSFLSGCLMNSKGNRRGCSCRATLRF
jgi:hypothetical protein